MTAATACPDAETLRQLAVAATPEPLSDVLARHLQACDGCARIFDGLVDPLIDILRRPAVTGSGGAEERGVAERAKRLVGAADSTVPESAGGELARSPDAAGDTQEYAPRRLGKFLLHSELGAGGMGWLRPNLTGITQLVGVLVTGVEARAYVVSSHSRHRNRTRVPITPACLMPHK